MSMNSLPQKTDDKAADTYRMEELATQLIKLWSDNLNASDEELARMMNIQFGHQLDLQDLRRIKHSNEFGELQIIAVETGLWAATATVTGKMKGLIDSMIQIAENGKSEIARVQAFRGINEYMRDFAPRRDSDMSGSRNMNVVQVLLQRTETEVIDVNAIEPAEIIDEESERKRYFEID